MENLRVKGICTKQYCTGGKATGIQDCNSISHNICLKYKSKHMGLNPQLMSTGLALLKSMEIYQLKPAKDLALILFLEMSI